MDQSSRKWWIGLGLVAPIAAGCVFMCRAVLNGFDLGETWFESADNTIEARSESNGCGSVDLTVTPAGTALVTWLERDPESERVTLRIGRHAVGSSLEPTRLTGTTLAESDRLFSNWADFPHVLALSETHAIVTYLERLGDGKYDYGVRFVGSTDGGSTWSEPRWLHDHVGPGEHGFVSLAREDDDTAVAVWLDGREMVDGEHGITGAMTLRMRTIGVDGSLGPERLLDPRVCDCCQTDVATAEPGVWLVAYRDRSEDEVRDVKVLRVTADDITTVFDSLDQFKFEGCPVNGPAIATRGDDVALVWFAPDLSGGGKVRVAKSCDRGRSFPTSATLDDDAPSGRVEVCFDECDLSYSRPSHVYALWLGRIEERPTWWYARLDPCSLGETGRFPSAFGLLASTSGDRDIGFPRACGTMSVFLAAYVSTEPDRRIVLHRAGFYIP